MVTGKAASALGTNVSISILSVIPRERRLSRLVDRSKSAGASASQLGLGTEAYVRAGAAAALGALLTPLAAVLGFIDSGDGPDADCTNLEQTAKAKSASVPAGTRHGEGAGTKKPLPTAH